MIMYDTLDEALEAQAPDIVHEANPTMMANMLMGLGATNHSMAPLGNGDPHYAYEAANSWMLGSPPTVKLGGDDDEYALYAWLVRIPFGAQGITYHTVLLVKERREDLKIVKAALMDANTPLQALLLWRRTTTA